MSDEYQERLALEDINELTKATAYMVMAPTLTFALIFGYNSFRTSGGGQSSNFQFAIDRAKSKFNTSDHNSASWPKNKETPEGKLDFSPSQAGAELNDAYKNLKAEKEATKAAELERKKSERQVTKMTNVEKTRAMVKNIDPFEKKRRLAMAI